MQSVCASSEVAFEPWRSCSLLASALVQVVVLTEVSTTHISLDRNRSYFKTDSQSWHPVPLWDLRSDIIYCRNVTVRNLRSCIRGRTLWREDGSPICSLITQWSESLRTCNHTLLSHLRLTQPRGPGSRIYIPQKQGGPVIPPDTGFPLHHLLRLAGLRWRYSIPPPT
jgi:hypothetical protein